MRLVLLLFLFFTACQFQENKNKPTSKIVTDTLESRVLNKSVAYRVYLPESYKTNPDLPVIYLLHGHGGSDDDWFTKEEGNAKTILDSLIQIKVIKPLIAVTFNAENSWYVDSKESMESAYINEFIPFIESKYELKKTDLSRIIAGNSAGGFGALRFSLKYPELFKAAILLSPASYSPLPPDISSSRKITAFAKDGIFNDSVWKSYSYTKLVDTITTKKYPIFYTSTGDHDEYQIFNLVSDLKAFFETHNISNETLVINGSHSWDVWQNCFTNDLIRIFNENDL